MILLDTQVVYWALTGDARLGECTRRHIEAAEVRYVSVVTQVEFTIKAMKGKLHVPDDLPTRLAELGLTTLAFTTEHARSLREFPALAAREPFDRMLLAQTHAEGLSFLTTDRVLLQFGRTVDAST